MCTYTNSPKKIVVIGPESTGKSTLAQMLAEHYNVDWVKEYARDYLAGLNRDYKKTDLLDIARGQILYEEEKKKNNTATHPFLFCDTDLYVIKVWSEHKYNYCDNWILQQIARRAYDLYLLTYIDTPWEPDPQREHPDPKMRQYFYKIYKDIVIHSGIPWASVHGNPRQRLRRSIEAINRYCG